MQYQTTYDYKSEKFSNVTFRQEYKIAGKEPQGLFKGLKAKKIAKSLGSVEGLLSDYSQEPEGMSADFGSSRVMLHSSKPCISVKREDNKVELVVWSVADVSEDDKYHFLLSQLTPKQKDKIESVKRQFENTVEGIDSQVRSIIAENKNLSLETETTARYWDFWKEHD